MGIKYGAPTDGAEKETLNGFLNYYRDLILEICSGLPEDDLRRPMVPTGTTLIGLVKHLSYVEWGWFREIMAGEDITYPFDTSDPTCDFRLDDGETISDVIDTYGEARKLSDAIIDEHQLEDIATGEHPSGDSYNLRWIMLHMLEEYARHAGHCDILREMIDGAVGFGYDRRLYAD